VDDEEKTYETPMWRTIRTRYTPANVLLLVVAGVVSLLITFLSVMTAGFGADPAHDFRSAALTCILIAALFNAPSYLAMFWWCGIGEVAIWIVTFFCFASMVVGGLLNYVGLLLLLILESLMFSGIASASRRTVVLGG
jgi:hypothetical protein